MIEMVIITAKPTKSGREAFGSFGIFRNCGRSTPGEVKNLI